MNYENSQDISLCHCVMTNKFAVRENAYTYIRAHSSVSAIIIVAHTCGKLGAMTSSIAETADLSQQDESAKRKNLTDNSFNLLL